MKLEPIAKLLVRNAGHKGLVTLMYHAVQSGTSIPDWPWAVSYKSFCDQLDLLQELGWHTACGRDLETNPTLPPRTVCITFDDGYANNFQAFEALARRGMRANWFVVTRDVGGSSSWPGERIPPQPMLNAQQLREMEDSGMEVCSHTVSHCRLTLADDETVAKELSDSRKQLSDILGRDVTTFAYPYGLHNKLVVEATRRAGYKVAFTTITGFGTAEDDLLQVRRIMVANTDSMSWFSRKLLFGWDDVSWRLIARNALEHAWERRHLVTVP